jgi:DNA repair protein RecN (Recombination protein N)
MIEEIVIRDLGVIREARLEFSPGLTVVTGETGAGKTMVLNALGLLLGERSDSSAIRLGQSQAFVEGRWLLPKEFAGFDRIREAGIEIEENEIILNRSVSSEGRSRAALSGRSVPVGLLSELGEQLVVVHGQSDQIRLRSAVAQRAALDQFAGPSLSELLKSYRSVFFNWKEVLEKLESLRSQLADRSREAEELRLAVTELDQLDPKPDEYLELTNQAERLTHLEDLRLAASAAHDNLSREDFEGAEDALSLVGKATRALEGACEHDSALAEIASQLRELGFSINETAANLSGYLANLDSSSSSELEAVQTRRSELSSAMRKYGPSLEQVIEFRQSASLRLLELDSSSEEIDTLSATEAELLSRATELAQQISSIRNAAAGELASSVTAELSALAMNGASLVVSVSQAAELNQFGFDQVSLMLSSFPGADPRPLGKGASGGELSRIMLAIEVVLAQTEQAPTFIFDEVDAGVGGAAATEVGRRLAKLAKGAQVIVVTHLPQVAAFANRHLRVLKTSSEAITSSDVVFLDGEEVVSELARMLSGLSESSTGRSHAAELLELARRDSAS